jgi:hypothetical protein
MQLLFSQNTESQVPYRLAASCISGKECKKRENFWLREAWEGNRADRRLRYMVSHSYFKIVMALLKFQVGIVSQLNLFKGMKNDF